MMDDIRAESLHVLNISSHSHSALWEGLSWQHSVRFPGSHNSSPHVSLLVTRLLPAASQDQLIISNSITSELQLFKQDIPEDQSESCELNVTYPAKLGMRLKRSHHKVDFTGSSCAYKIDIS